MSDFKAKMPKFNFRSIWGAGSLQHSPRPVAVCLQHIVRQSKGSVTRRCHLMSKK